MGIPEIVEIFNKYGSGPLFLGLYLAAMVYVVRQAKSHTTEQRKNRDELVVITQSVTTALDRAREATDREVKVVEEMQKSLNENSAQTREFMAYLRGKDSREPR